MGTRMENSENISAVFPRISAILGVGNRLDQKSPTENVLGENACPAWCFGKILDPKTGSSFPLDHAIPNYPKKGLLYARYFNRF